MQPIKTFIDSDLSFEKILNTIAIYSELDIQKKYSHISIPKNCDFLFLYSGHVRSFAKTYPSQKKILLSS